MVQSWIDKFETYWADLAIQPNHQQDGSHDISHIRRVWRNCNEIMDKELTEVDTLTLLAACYFHDLINLPKNAPDRHLASLKSAGEAVKILDYFQFPPGKLAEIHHAIAAHSFSAGIKPKTIEAKILQDADRLDALGAIGIARMFIIAGQMRSNIYHADDPAADNRDHDDKQYSMDHFHTKLFRLENTMQTKAGKEIAKQRTNVMRKFLKMLLSEIN